ncbi:MAG TPA: hypothetical protein VJH03_10550 [Blastocatellia bacterium]|nr:hypothetical protein [Blastocatellia bacterium]
MKTLQQGKAASNRRRVVARLLTGVVVVVSLMMPGWQETGAGGQTTCRQASSLNINDITGAFRTLVHLNPDQWIVMFQLNTNRHRMDCPGTTGLIACTPDKFISRSDIAIGVGDVENVDGTSCRETWMVTASSATGAVFFGFKIKFQEDVMINPNQPFNARRRLGLVALPRNIEALGQTVDMTGQLVDAGDDGVDN